MTIGPAVKINPDSVSIFAGGFGQARPARPGAASLGDTGGPKGVAGVAALLGLKPDSSRDEIVGAIKMNADEDIIDEIAELLGLDSSASVDEVLDAMLARVDAEAAAERAATMAAGGRMPSVNEIANAVAKSRATPVRSARIITALGLLSTATLDDAMRAVEQAAPERLAEIAARLGVAGADVVSITREVVRAVLGEAELARIEREISNRSAMRAIFAGSPELREEYRGDFEAFASYQEACRDGAFCGPGTARFAASQAGSPAHRATGRSVVSRE